MMHTHIYIIIYIIYTDLDIFLTGVGLCGAQKCKMHEYLAEMKLLKSCLLSQLACVFHVSDIGSGFVYFTSKCCVSYGPMGSRISIISFSLPKCCIPYGFGVLFEMFFMIFLYQVHIQFHCPV